MCAQNSCKGTIFFRNDQIKRVFMYRDDYLKICIVSNEGNGWADRAFEDGKYA
jgi:hypothetical protein